MNRRRIIILVVLSFVSLFSKAQTFGFNAWGNGYMGVNNFSGNQSKDAVVIRMECSCAPIINVPNWKISARVTQPIKSTDGTRTFPPEMISLQPNRTVGNQTPGPVPSISQIGMPASVPLSLSEVFLVPQSNARLRNESYYFYTELYFDLTVAGGAYLADLQGGYTQKRYPVNLEFTFYGANNQPLGSKSYKYYIDVFKLSGAPTEDKSYTLSINGGARSGNLVLQSRADYQNGTSVTYSGGLTVRTNTDYEVKVKALAPAFSHEGHTIDLDVVNMNLTSASSSVSSLNSITLSTGDQVIARGSSTGKQDLHFDVNYYINQANRNKLIYAWKKPGYQTTAYGVSLQYTITPP